LRKCAFSRWRLHCPRLTWLLLLTAQLWLPPLLRRLLLLLLPLLQRAVVPGRHQWWSTCALAHGSCRCEPLYMQVLLCLLKLLQVAQWRWLLLRLLRLLQLLSLMCLAQVLLPLLLRLLLPLQCLLLRRLRPVLQLARTGWWHLSRHGSCLSHRCRHRWPLLRWLYIWLSLHLPPWPGSCG